MGRDDPLRELHRLRRWLTVRVGKRLDAFFFLFLSLIPFLFIIISTIPPHPLPLTTTNTQMLSPSPAHRRRLLLPSDEAGGGGLSPWQLGCPELIPKLTSRPLWNTSDFPWIATLENSYKEIREELMSLKGKEVFQVGAVGESR